MSKTAQVPVIIRKTVSEISTPQGNVQLENYKFVDVRCDHRDKVHVGDRITIAAGKKIPIGTEAIVKGVGRNKFENEAGKNPCLLLILDDESEVWTTGNNCINLTEVKNSVDGEIRKFNALELFNCKLKEEGYESSDPVWYFEGEPGESNICKATAYLTDHGYSLLKDSSGKNYFKVVNDEYAMILDDWKTNTYVFLVIKSKYAPGNLVKLVNTLSGSKDSSLKDSITEYNNYN